LNSEAVEMIPSQPNEDSVLAQAVKLIDPSGTIVPGSSQYSVIVEMIESWIHQHGPYAALEMARKSARHLDVWRKHL
jgi:hypothetical protein